MPEPVLDHEGFTQDQSVALALLTQGCESTQAADDKGKAIVQDDAGASGVIDREVNTDASSSSSSSSQESIKSLRLDDSSSLINQLATLSLNDTGKERPTTEANAQIIVAAFFQPGDVNSNSNIAPSAASNGKRKAEEATTEALAKVTKAMSEADAHWHNHQPQLFRDLPDQASTSSGLGQHRCMELMNLPEEPPHLADPIDLQEPVHEPEQISLRTFRIPTFGFDQVLLLDGGPVLVPFLDELQFEDHEELGDGWFLEQEHVVMDED